MDGVALLIASRRQRTVRRPDIDERSARRGLREQVVRLERDLSELQCSAWPRTDIQVRPGAAGTARMLSLAELEAERDRLAAETARLRRALHERGEQEEPRRRLVEEMLLDPDKYRWVRVSNEDIGEPGCHHWHVQPRWGLLGMLLKWWRVRISSGCP